MTIRFRTGWTSGKLTYRWVSEDDAKRVIGAHQKGNLGPVLFKTWRKTVSIVVSEFKIIEIW